MKSNAAYLWGALLLLLPVLVYAAQGSPPAEASAKGYDRDFVEKVVIALVSAVLAFSGNFLLAAIKRRSEPKKELSYNTSVSGGLVRIEDTVRQRIKVEYQGMTVNDLYHVQCSIENSGTSVIKDQYVRFAIAGPGDLIDYYLDPSPEPELKVEEVPVEPQATVGKRYRIGHIERGQRIVFHFITAGTAAPELKLHPFNEEGDVDFVPRSISVAAGQAQKISEFLYLYLFFLLLPPALRSLPYGLGVAPAAIVMLFLLLLMIPRMGIFSRLTAEILQRWAEPIPANSTYNIRADEIGTFEVHNK